MPKKYRFRKMYFVCEDKKVITPDVYMTQAYQYKETAETVAKERQRNRLKIWEDKTKPISQQTAEAFYLVPQALYKEILKEWDRDAK